MLTPKKELFAKEYLVDMNATKAAIRAGYSEDTAYSQGQRLLKDVETAALIQEGIQERANNVNLTAEYVLSTIIETIERSRQSVPVLNRKGEQVFVETEDGTVAAAYTFNAKGVLQGTEQLGKHLKLFTEKTELSGPNGSDLPSMNITVSFGKHETDTPDSTDNTSS